MADVPQIPWDESEDSTRGRKHQQMVSEILNILVRDGLILYVGPGRWTLSSALADYVLKTLTIQVGSVAQDLSANRTFQILAIDLVNANNAQTGTTYSLVLSDAGKTLTLSNASAITLTVPTHASQAFPVGAQVNIAQLGAGQVTVAAAGGVTLNSKLSNVKLTGQYSGAYIVNTAQDVWLLVGDLSS